MLHNTLIQNTEDVNTVTLLLNLIGHSENYSMTSGCFWNYFIAEVKAMAIMWVNALEGKSYEKH